MIRKGFSDRLKEVIKILSQRSYPSTCKTSLDCGCVKPVTEKFVAKARPVELKVNTPININSEHNSTKDVLDFKEPQVRFPQDVDVGFKNTTEYVNNLIEPYTCNDPINKISAPSNDTVLKLANHHKTTNQVGFLPALVSYNGMNLPPLFVVPQLVWNYTPVYPYHARIN